MINVNNRYDLGDKVYVVTRHKHGEWFVPSNTFTIDLIKILTFGHLAPKPAVQISYKIPNPYSKIAMYPETRVFKDYESALWHCEVLNKYKLKELVIEEDGTIWKNEKRKQCIIRQHDFFSNPSDNCQMLYYKTNPFDEEFVWIYETEYGGKFIRGCHISKIITDKDEIMKTIFNRSLGRTEESANGNR